MKPIVYYWRFSPANGKQIANLTLDQFQIIKASKKVIKAPPRNETDQK